MKTTNIFSMAAITIMALFTSCSEPDYLGEENGHQYVDLSLPSGTKWATCNIGADSKADYGNYYAWGETSPKSEYRFSTYAFMDKSINSDYGYTKYTIPDGVYSAPWYDFDYNFIGDNKSQLDDVDDVAVQVWGGKWKTPTAAQIAELKNECYWVWTTDYQDTHVKGFIVYKAKSNNDKGKTSLNITTTNSYDISHDANIFFPASGYREDVNTYGDGSYGFIWSSSLSDYTTRAYVLSLDRSNIIRSAESRRYGFVVRAVCITEEE